MGPTWVLSAPDGPHVLCYQGSYFALDKNTLCLVVACKLWDRISHSEQKTESWTMLFTLSFSSSMQYHELSQLPMICHKIKLSVYLVQPFNCTTMAIQLYNNVHTTHGVTGKQRAGVINTYYGKLYEAASKYIPSTIWQDRWVGGGETYNLVCYLNVVLMWLIPP